MKITQVVYFILYCGPRNSLNLTAEQ